MKFLRLMPRFRLNRRIIVALAVVAVFIGTGAAVWVTNPSANDPLEAYAKQVIKKCAKTPSPTSCYDTEIPKLMDRGVTMEQAFQVTALIQNKTQGYFYCHVLGHNLAGKETAKDPTKWTEVIGECPAGQCSNGCIHGAAQERFKAESLTPPQVQSVLPELSDICFGTARNFTGLERNSCTHTLGHLAMYLTKGDVTAATGICDTIATHDGEDHTIACYEGVFMMVFQPLEPEDFGLVRDYAPTTRISAQKYCDSFSGERQGACLRQAWPLYENGLFTPLGLQAFCSLSPVQHQQDRCYSAQFYNLTAQYQFDVQRVSSVCAALPAQLMKQCFSMSATRFVDTDYRLAPRSAELCGIAESKGVGDACYQQLLFFSTYNYHSGSPEFTAFCEYLPGKWKEKCLAGNGSA